MFTRVKTAKEIINMRASGQILAEILEEVRAMACEGVTGREIDDFVLKKASLAGARCSFKGYRGYPAHICISVNDVINHGIPGAKPLKKGDVATFDFGITYNGMITDSAFTMVVGEEPSGDKKRLLDATETALYAGLEEIDADDHTGDISAAVQGVLEQAGLGIVRELVGHGIGHVVHEQPDIPNYGRAGSGPLLKKGMTLAIEPMLTLGGEETRVLADDWTVVTADGSWSAHFEHTVAITDGDPLILTERLVSMVQ